jgi:hypothetical protein
MMLITEKDEIIGAEICRKIKRGIEFYHFQRIMFKWTMGREA